MYRLRIFICLLLLSARLVKGQTAVLENNRTGLKWQYIETNDFKIVFPKGFESEGQRMANTLQLIHDPVDQSLGTNTRSATILLQNQNAIANGFVTLGPRRSELYTSSPQDYNFLGTNNWLNLLAIHEYRHLAQFNKSRTGFNKLLYYLFGENTQAAIASIVAPQWFWEGDAVVAETAFTKSGRGRIPAFNRILRANLLEGKRFNYQKQFLRSYRDFVPNHYVLGYHFVSHIRKKTNNKNIFSAVTQRTWSYPFIPFSFSNALKKNTGKYLLEHYEDMMDELEEEWSRQLQNTKLSFFEKVTQRKNKAFIDYSCPSPMANGKLFVVKSGIGNITQFVMIGEEGSEEKLFTPGILNNSGMLSVSGNTVAWNEYTFDPRWRNQSYSVIKLYNQDTKALKVLTKKTSYHSVSLSPDTRQVATVESLKNGTYRLVILDAKTGAVVKQYRNQTQGILTLPAWSSDGQKITFLSNASEKKSVQMIEVKSEKETVLMPPNTENIGNPSMVNEYLFYQSDYSGIDNIYALNTNTNRRYQITSSKYGAYNFSLSNDKKTVFYNDHSVNGLDVVRMPLDSSQWVPLSQVTQNKVGYYKTLEQQESHTHILDSVPNRQYEVKKYSPLKKLIHPHSWGPFVNTNDLNQVQAGVFSKNILSTMFIYAGYDYDADTKDGAFVGRVSYQGFYPILDFEFSKGNKSSGTATWDEQTIEYGVRLPLLLTKSKYHEQLTVGNSIGYRTVNSYENGVNNLGRNFDYELELDNEVLARVRGVNISELDHGTLIYNKTTVSYLRLLKQSKRDINSEFGQILAFENFSTLRGKYVGNLTALRGVLYFPGIWKHHSFYLRGSIQFRKIIDDSNLYAFSNRAFRPRGYDSYPTEKNRHWYSLTTLCHCGIQISL